MIMAASDEIADITEGASRANSGLHFQSTETPNVL